MIDEDAFCKALQGNAAGSMLQPGGCGWVRKFLEAYETARTVATPQDKKGAIARRLRARLSEEYFTEADIHKLTNEIAECFTKQ